MPTDAAADSCSDIALPAEKDHLQHKQRIADLEAQLLVKEADFQQGQETVAASADCVKTLRDTVTFLREELKRQSRHVNQFGQLKLGSFSALHLPTTQQSKHLLQSQQAVQRFQNRRNSSQARTQCFNRFGPTSLCSGTTASQTVRARNKHPVLRIRPASFLHHLWHPRPRLYIKQAPSAQPAEKAFKFAAKPDAHGHGTGRNIIFISELIIVVTCAYTGI